jgi:hypothetical protein
MSQEMFRANTDPKFKYVDQSAKDLGPVVVLKYKHVETDEEKHVFKLKMQGQLTKMDQKPTEFSNGKEGYFANVTITKDDGEVLKTRTIFNKKYVQDVELTNFTEGRELRLLGQLKTSSKGITSWLFDGSLAGTAVEASAITISDEATSTISKFMEATKATQASN